MNAKQSRVRTRRAMQGSILAEAVLVFPVVIMVLMAGFELIGYLEARSSLEWAAAEGMSYAATTTATGAAGTSPMEVSAQFDPEVGSFKGDFIQISQSCFSASSATRTCTANRVVDTVGKSLKSAQGKFQGLRPVDISATLLEPAGAPRSVQIRLSTSYKPILFGALWNVTVSYSMSSQIG